MGQSAKRRRRGWHDLPTVLAPTINLVVRSRCENISQCPRMNDSLSWFATATAAVPSAAGCG